MLNLICNYCNKSFTRSKSDCNKTKKLNLKTFCSKSCMNKSRTLKIEVNCTNCGKKLLRTKSKTKSKTLFCGHSCRATYGNKHRTHGYRRSKLEIWLEEQLVNLYSDLEFHFNKKDTIMSELDIYIPSLKLAFELNGIFHYEPIYGEEKLNQIQNNDHRKFQACAENGISLCIIDTSSQKKFTEKSSYKFLEIITNIIDQKL